MAQELANILKDLRPDDVRVDSFGRVIITSPSLIEQLKSAGKIGADELARSDTNIICCGNSKCGASNDLGSLIERFTQGSGLGGPSS